MNLARLARAYEPGRRHEPCAPRSRLGAAGNGTNITRLANVDFPWRSAPRSAADPAPGRTAADFIHDLDAGPPQLITELVRARKVSRSARLGPLLDQRSELRGQLWALEPGDLRRPQAVE